ncbi:Hypothetical predicted protein [Olea europaea subsp. europaea]|uniref:Uncharacterized protein n=1 Tax=Olea europaea subsp. europaea TaxID=158383 RepID=A0A8S0VGV3_OLEEU|nr:Hypothetical predicted protein [Olea europaea subsp. europaea]
MRFRVAVKLVGFGEGAVDEGNLDEVFERWSNRIVGVLKSNLGENEACNGNYGNGSESEVGKAPSRKSVVGPKMKKEMVTPMVRASLLKQLRGHEGCYKHSLYSIESHRCMEATPSLGCANKCVFCLRHHTNPEGKSWWWKMDDPIVIVDTAIDLHMKMIGQMKGLPTIEKQQQRTVYYRLTLVKEWNAVDVESYSNLFGIRDPDFIEIKGVTYCGS